LKTSSLSLLTAATVLLTAAIFAITTIAEAAQAPVQAAPVPAQASPAPAAGSAPAPQRRTYAGPVNLRVLPKTLNGQQVRDIMEQWEGELGVHCSTCHVADPKDIGPNGKPRLNFADDSKEEKETARVMYKMTEDINANYVSKVPSSDMPVTCGTCHRGHLGPEPFVVPEEDHDRPKTAPAPGAKPGQ
jgi:Photosynthetic reaction centre cytochrome C subunit